MKRPPGRPPLDDDDPSVKVSLSLPSKKFDELCEQARRQGTSVPERIRRLIYGNSYTLLQQKNTKK